MTSTLSLPWLLYQNLENLLIFAAGNSGGLKDVNINHCTVSSPALGKNVLTVGSSSAGPSRSPITGADGRARYEEMGMDNYSPEGYPWICESPSLGLPSTSSDPADVDTLSYFSSYGPAKDGRIKPEIVAPGERVRMTHRNACKRFNRKRRYFSIRTIIEL